MLKVLFIGYGDFQYAGVKHVHHFANGLAGLGLQVMVLIPGDSGTAALMAEPPRFELVPVRFVGPFLAGATRRVATRFAPEVIHAWTPRNIPARVGWELKQRTGARLVVDYEDDEDMHYQAHVQAMGKHLSPALRRLLWPLLKARLVLKPLLWPMNWKGGQPYVPKHPLTYQLVNRAADAFTAICTPLKERLEREWPEKPAYLLYPGADLRRFSPQADGQGVRQRYGLDGLKVLLYSGTANTTILDSLLQVLERVRARYPEATLVHVGNDDFREEAIAHIERRGLQDHVVLTGIVPHREMPCYLAAADVLLQHNYDLSNEYRLPAKLPEYLAMGQPVVTFSAGIGRILEDGVDVLKVSTDRPEEMAEKVLRILDDESLSRGLGANARRKAEALFDWSKNARTLARIYEEVLAQPVEAAQARELREWGFR